MIGEETYGFNKPDAEALIQSISTTEREHPQRVPRDGDSFQSIEYTIVSTTTAESGPYTGLVVATVEVQGVSCNADYALIGTEVSVVDHSGEIFDLPNLVGCWGWADLKVFLSLDSGADPGELTECHWSATNRGCCAS